MERTLSCFNWNSLVSHEYNIFESTIGNPIFNNHPFPILYTHMKNMFEYMLWWFVLLMSCMSQYFTPFDELLYTENISCVFKLYVVWSDAELYYNIMSYTVKCALRFIRMVALHLLSCILPDECYLFDYLTLKTITLFSGPNCWLDNKVIPEGERIYIDKCRFCYCSNMEYIYNATQRHASCVRSFFCL